MRDELPRDPHPLALCLAGAVALAWSCAPLPLDDKTSCTTDAHCTRGWHCYDGTCRSAPLVDDGPSETAPSDGGPKHALTAMEGGTSDADHDAPTTMDSGSGDAARDDSDAPRTDSEDTPHTDSDEDSGGADFDAMKIGRAHV